MILGSVCWANQSDINFLDNTCGSRGGALAMIILGAIFSAYVYILHPILTLTGYTYFGSLYMLIFDLQKDVLVGCQDINKHAEK